MNFRGAGGGPEPADSALRGLVRTELEKILDSPHFRQSQQSQKLLRHLVEHSLDGQFDELKERVIGVELFGRPAGFDTNDDPIVRVRATEVRKRLARYYEDLAGAPPVRLELPAGAYRIEFRAPGEDGSALVEPGAKPGWRRSGKALAAAFMMLAAGMAFLVHRQPEVEDEFWAPVLAGRSKVIVCTGHPVVYRFSTDFLMRRGEKLDFLGKQTSVVELQPEETVRGKDIVPIPDQYIGLGSAHATAQIAAFLARRGKEAEIRFGDDISFTDLRQAPAVLVSFANRWSFGASADIRFIPELDGDGKSRIVDRKTGRKWELPALQDNGRTDEDYILVTRLTASESGQGVLVVAGLTQYGTQAAGEIVTNRALLSRALSGVKSGWRDRNLQLLFHVRVVNHTPGPPRLLATHGW